MKFTYIAAAILAIGGAPAFAAGDYGSSSSGSGSVQSGSTGSGAMSSGSASGSAQMKSDSETIRQAQQQLSQQGHQVSADGVMGPQTRSALKKFQREKGLQASGSLDQSTLTALGIDQSGGSGSVGASPSSGSSSGSSSGASTPSAPNPATGSGSMERNAPSTTEGAIPNPPGAPSTPTTKDSRY